MVFFQQISMDSIWEMWYQSYKVGLRIQLYYWGCNLNYTPFTAGSGAQICRFQSICRGQLQIGHGGVLYVKGLDLKETYQIEMVGEACYIIDSFFLLWKGPLISINIIDIKLGEIMSGKPYFDIFEILILPLWRGRLSLSDALVMLEGQTSEST